MSMKMKGLLKGLRYISTIFDEEEEAEMQIGFPTDVKHVAHIGWDGPTTNSPSWINQFKDGEGGGGGGGGASNVEDQQNAARPRDLRGSVQEKRFPTGPDSPVQSPSRKRSDKSKGSRRANSASSAVESPRRSSTSSETRKQQQQQQQQEQQQQQLPPAAAAEGEQTSKTSSRRKKPKSGSSGAQSSSRASNKSKSTAPTENFSHYSDPGVRGNTSRNNVAADQTTGRRAKGKDTCQGSVLKAASDQDDPKSMDDISRGIQAM